MRRIAWSRLSRRRYTLATITGGLAVAAAIFLAGAGGAGGNPSSSEGVSAKPLSAKAFGPRVVDVASLPKATARPHAVQKPRLRAPLSPLGRAGLTSAKKNAPADAPAMGGPISAPPVPRTPGPSLGGFDGMEDSDAICPPFGCQPSDQGIASNGELVIQTVNTAVNVYDPSGAVQTGFPKTLQAFFGVPDVDCDPGSDNVPFLADPRVLYDPADHRFIAATLQVEGAFGVAEDCPETSLYWVAVSQTDDPTGAWNVYSIDTRLLGGDADYTQLGFNGEAIFIGGNVFDQSGFAYLGAFVLALPKSLMEAGDPIGTPHGFGGFTVKDQLLDTVHPVASYGAGDGGPDGEFLVSSYNTAKKAQNIVVFNFSNALAGTGPCGTANQCLSGVTLKTLKFSQPPLADNGDICNDCVETIDTRVSATPVYMHGNIYFTHDTAVKVGGIVNANVLWGVVHPALDQTIVPGCSLCSTITSKTRMVDQGYLTYPGETDTWFGAIQPDREGNLFIGFDYQSETLLMNGSPVTPSSVYVSRRATAAPGSGFDVGFFLRASTDPTFNDRWGDYSAIGFDGWGGNGVWFATQYANAGFDWSTHVDQLGYTALAEK